jgi:hypothetical protein
MLVVTEHSLWFYKPSSRHEDDASGSGSVRSGDYIFGKAVGRMPLGTANVTVSTGSSGTQAGTITVSNAVSWASGNTLTLNAASNITVNAALSATGGGGAVL